MKNDQFVVISIVLTTLILLVGTAVTAKSATDSKPSTHNSRTCLRIDTLSATYVPTTPEYCEVKRNNLCYDLVYNFKFTNACEKSVDVRWKFAHSTDPSYSTQKLSPNEIHRVSCRKQLQRCDGRISYNSRFAN